MSFRGNFSGSRGFSRGGRGRGGGGDFRRNYDQGPPDTVVPFGFYNYSCQDELICKVEIEDVPYFNAPIYLKNKEQIGKIDEIFGNIKDYFVSIKPSENIKASTFPLDEKLFIDPNKLLPLKRFLPHPPGTKKMRGAGRGGFGRGSGGGRGGNFRGGGGGRRDGRGFGGGGRWNGGGRGRGGFNQREGGGFRSQGGFSSGPGSSRGEGGFRKGFGGGGYNN